MIGVVILFAWVDRLAGNERLERRLRFWPMTEDNVISILLLRKQQIILFGLMKLTTNGSDANLYAVTSQTQGNTSGCLVACGSYVSGDSGPLQSWSTSAFDIGSGPSGIISPEDRRITPFTLEHTIALPYFFEGTMCDDDRRKYENDCLEHLHIMCLYKEESYMYFDGDHFGIKRIHCK